MPSKTYLPQKDAALLAWGNNASTVLGPDGTAYGLDAATITAYHAALAAYAAALALAQPSNRNPGATANKNEKRTALIENIRAWVATVDATPTVTTQMRLDLGLSVRSMPTPIPTPSNSPNLDVIKVVGRTVSCRVHSDDALKRGKPAGCAGVFIYSYVGPTPPSDPSLFKIEGTCTKPTFEIVFPASVAGGAQVWISAAWFNPRTLNGPACTPVTAFLQGAAAAAA